MVVLGSFGAEYRPDFDPVVTSQQALWLVEKRLQIELEAYQALLLQSCSLRLVVEELI